MKMIDAERAGISIVLRIRSFAASEKFVNLVYKWQFSSITHTIIRDCITFYQITLSGVSLFDRRFLEAQCLLLYEASNKRVYKE